MWLFVTLFLSSLIFGYSEGIEALITYPDNPWGSVADVNATVEAADANNDGKLNYDEFVNAIDGVAKFRYTTQGFYDYMAAEGGGEVLVQTILDMYMLGDYDNDGELHIGDCFDAYFMTGYSPTRHGGK